MSVKPEAVRVVPVAFQQEARGEVMLKTGSVSAESGAPDTVSSSRAGSGVPSSTPPPLCTSAEKHPAAPAESFSSSILQPLDNTHGHPAEPYDKAAAQKSEDDFADYVDGFGKADRCQEFDDRTGETIRFDDCAPIQLERRGVTSQAPEPLSGSKTPLWQSEFWTRQTIQKNTVAAKLREFGREDLFQGLTDCHSTFTVARCGDCGAVKRFPNRCDLFYCPECQPRLAAERRRAVEWWTKLVCQPKHVVLTVQNVSELTREHVQEFKKWWGKLRRRKFASNWLGGFYSIELTNEGRGWHLHLHALIDAKWIDAGELARQWNTVTNGLGKIVCVKDARRENYLAEVTKYAVKGVDMAKWSGKDINTFIAAFDGVRTFGVFGSLYGARTKFAEFIATLRDAKPKCECGSCNVQYYSEAQFLLLDLQHGAESKPIPPPPDANQMALFDTHIQPHEVGA